MNDEKIIIYEYVVDVRVLEVDGGGGGDSEIEYEIVVAVRWHWQHTQKKGKHQKRPSRLRKGEEEASNILENEILIAMLSLLLLPRA